ncbi:asparagine synthase (glutamine-hydrolyzing) [Chitinimonas arctica]|uniref:asparagine synthase (glutamine-hydrolyzing) n=1 Tax=Chitinimonas arctica TaxID=2594795 RepID=A0A516SGI0_9NEIS|nr:asparagine synthase (glutamine-hydrolyzing) [Chitinimonas arctica]QDQ27271.1 asparagine synthase (glutamine-hydrolyzing) [Chitinimonas arctica]
MCGIAGFIGKRPISAQARASMLAALRQRGPDSQHERAWHADGSEVDAGEAACSALLHARLAIMDPRPQADQPMVSEGGDIWLCYNGEVYGWQDDAAVLQRGGAVFHTHSDTEFILRAYEAWGLEGMLPRLRGMFALAILDRRLGKLYLVRDRMGEKPLVYARRPDGVAFGSTVRSVLPWLPADARGFDPAAIDAYLAHRYIPAPRTIFSAIERLENGHYLEIDLLNHDLRKHRYWQPAAQGDCTAAEALGELAKAVELRTVADRPLGVFLSGGIDSSCVASLLAASGHGELNTFTAAFPGTPFDESADAAEIAACLGLRNQPLAIPSRIGEQFARIVADLDEPFADPSSFPTWYLAQATVRHVTVVLGGDGGDELLAGYKRHPKHLKSAWRGKLRLPLQGGSSLRGKGWAKVADELGMDWQQSYSLRFSGFGPSQRRFLCGGAALRQNVWWRAPDSDESRPLQQLLAIDFANTLPEYILRKGDLCTMAHGLELRAPLLDHVWLEKLLGVPDAERFSQPAKRMLAASMPQLAPLALFQRKKRGFNPPLQASLNDLADRLDGLGERLAALTDHLLAEAPVQAFADAYRQGDGALAEQLLQLLVLDESLAQLATLRATP